MEILPILTKWAAIMQRAQSAADQLNAVGMLPEAPILGALWAATDALTEAVELQLGVKRLHWLQWYAWDNSMGAAAFEAGYDGDTRKIRTLEDLAWLVDLARAKE